MPAVCTKRWARRPETHFSVTRCAFPVTLTGDPVIAAGDPVTELRGSVAQHGFFVPGPEYFKNAVEDRLAVDVNSDSDDGEAA